MATTTLTAPDRSLIYLSLRKAGLFLVSYLIFVLGLFFFLFVYSFLFQGGYKYAMYEFGSQIYFTDFLPLIIALILGSLVTGATTAFVVRYGTLIERDDDFIQIRQKMIRNHTSRLPLSSVISTESSQEPLARAMDLSSLRIHVLDSEDLVLTGFDTNDLDQFSRTIGK